VTVRTQILTNPKRDAAISAGAVVNAAPTSAESDADAVEFDVLSKHVQQIEVADDDKDDDDGNDENDENDDDDDYDAAEFVDVGNNKGDKSSSVDVTSTDVSANTAVDDGDAEDPNGGEWINNENLRDVLAKAHYGVEEVVRCVRCVCVVVMRK
jgi:hypothetical protein